METYDDYVTEVSTAMLDGKSAFLVGAGISVNRNTWLPDWGGLIHELLKSIAGPKNDLETKYIHENYMQLLFNEVFLHLMSEVLGSAYVMDAIKKCYDITEYNRIHKFLAWSMLYFHSVVLTTNYDELIERAGGLKTKPVKLHGSLNMPESMRFTVNHIFSPLASEIRDSTAAKLKGRTLVVIGYRGADEFDVIPFLFEEANLLKFIWITHGDPEKDLAPETRKRLDKRGDPYFRANADDFLKAIYDSTREFVGNDEELDQWNQWEIGHPGKTEGWWKQGLASWEERIKEVHGSKVDLLWAKTLDYLRIYELNLNKVILRPAEDSYKLFLKNNLEPIYELETNLQLAYIQRITRTDESEYSKNKLVDSFKIIIKIVQNKLSRMEKTEDEYFRLQKLLARAHHELGIALQNQDHHPEANFHFDEAIRLRRLSNDPEVAYSIFLQFMNSAIAYRSEKIKDITEFIPKWRDSLLFELEQNAFLFRDSSEPENYSTTLHNLAYIYQFIAEEYERAKRLKDASKEYSHAIKMYENAKVIRERLRDPRRIAQSNVRIAECKLGLARCELVSARGFIDDANRLADEVEEHYQKIPQEKFRRDDLENIRSWIIKLNRQLND
jgi:hypothetical protein